MLGRGHEPRTRQQHAYSEHFEALGGGLHKLFEALSTHTARQQTSEGMGSRSAPAYRPPRPLRGVGVGSYGAPLGLPNIHIQQQLRRKPSARRDRSRRDASIHLYGDLFRGLGCENGHQQNWCILHVHRFRRAATASRGKSCEKLTHHIKARSAHMQALASSEAKGKHMRPLRRGHDMLSSSTMEPPFCSRTRTRTRFNKNQNQNKHTNKEQHKNKNKNHIPLPTD